MHKVSFASVFVLASLASGSAGASDCKLSYSHPNKAWIASCGLSRVDPKWNGYIQGPLAGAKLEFRAADGGKKIAAIDGKTLVDAGIQNLESIPFCANVDPDADKKDPVAMGQLDQCQKIAAAVGLTVPFYLKSYIQDPSAFTLAAKFDKKAKGLAAGSELQVPVCIPDADKLPKEAEEIDGFRSRMECHWAQTKPQMFSSAGAGNIGPSHPEFLPDQGYLPGSDKFAPDLYASNAVACGGKPNGSTKACIGRVVCEDRSRRKFPAERDPKARAKQFAEALKAAGLPSLEDFEAAKKKTDAQEEPDRLNGDVKNGRKLAMLQLPKDAGGNPYVPEAFVRTFKPRLTLDKQGYVEGLNVYPNGNHGADLLGGDVRRYSTSEKPDLTKLYALMRIPPLAQELAKIPVAPGAKGDGCLASALDASATKEDRDLVAKLDEGIKNGGGFGMNQTCLGVAEIGRARTYIADRMDFETIAWAAKADLWAGENSITSASNSKIIADYGTTLQSIQNLSPSYLAKDDQYIGYETADFMLNSSAFHPKAAKGLAITPNVDRVKANRKAMMDERNAVTKQLTIDNGANYTKTDKALVTDPMEVTCLPPDGKACNPENVDPIACLTDNQVGRMTQADLRAGKKTTGGVKSPEKKMKDASDAFKAN